MVRKIGQLLLNGRGGGCHPPAPSLCLILDGRSDLKKIFKDRCPKDEPKAKNLVCKKALHILREKLEKPVEGWHPSPWPLEG